MGETANALGMFARGRQEKGKRGFFLRRKFSERRVMQITTVSFI